MFTTPSMQDMLEAGVHFGHKVSRGNPQMKPYVFGARDGIHIIDLAQSESLLKDAAQYVYELGRAGKVLLVVGTKKQSREIAEATARDAQTYYVTAHWMGGMLTNFDEVRKNILKLVTLKKEKEAGTLNRVKREQMLIGRLIEKFDRNLGGVADMDKLPDAVFIMDIVADNIAVREAERANIPVVGVADTNSNPMMVAHPIPANDDGIKSIKLICETIMSAYKQGKEEFVVAGVAQAKADAEAKAAAEEEALHPTKIPVSEPIAQEVAAVEEEIEKAEVKESGKVA